MDGLPQNNGKQLDAAFTGLALLNMDTKKRKLKEQFINGINNSDMMTEVIWELTTIKKMNSPVSKY